MAIASGIGDRGACDDEEDCCGCDYYARDQAATPGCRILNPRDLGSDGWIREERDQRCQLLPTMPAQCEVTERCGRETLLRAFSDQAGQLDLIKTRSRLSGATVSRCDDCHHRAFQVAQPSLAVIAVKQVLTAEFPTSALGAQGQKEQVRV
jgi:hypothetical protein